MSYGLHEIGADLVSHGMASSPPSSDMSAAPSTPPALPRLGSAAVVVDGDGRLLLGVRAKPPLEGHWVLPGGGVQPFESLADAVEREVLEETGLVVKAREQVGVWEVVEPPHQHRVIVYSRAEVVGGRLESADDLQGARFWTREQVGELALTPLVSDVLRHLGWLDVTAVTSPQSRHAA
jgi:8-oxo-dGTP diphosphatase